MRIKINWRVKQVLIGLGLLALCAIMLMMTANATSPEDKDATPVLLLGPIGLYLVLSKQQFIH